MGIETIKTSTVFNVPAKESSNQPLLNDCLHTEPALQLLLHDILIKNRTKPLVLLGDVKQAFLQIRINKEDQDALSLQLVKDLTNLDIINLRFTHVLSGCAVISFILYTTLLKTCTWWKRYRVTCLRII